MTLNVTVLTTQTIYVSADFRLTDPRTRRVITDRSPKTVTLNYTGWSGFVTYTGVGSWQGQNLSDLVADWLTGPVQLSIGDVAQIIATKGTELLRIIERQHGRMPHTFTLAGFDGDRVRVYVISNFEDCRGNVRAAVDNQLTVTTRSLSRGKRATVIVTGQKAALSSEARRLLGSLAGNFPGDGLRIRRRMAELNAEAAARSKGTVSRGCIVFSFSADGSGTMLLDANAVEIPRQFPHILNGMNMSKVALKAFKELGIDPSTVRTNNATFASSRGQQVSLRGVPCNYAIRDSDPPSGYQLSEITSTEFEPMSPRDISDRGQAVGTGIAAKGRPQDIPWSYSDGRIDRLDYTGLAAAVNNRGQIVAVLNRTAASGSNTQLAALYDGGILTELPLYHGQPGVFEGTDSTGRAINAQGMIAGEVRSQTEEQGRANTRAALFQLGEPTFALLEPAADFGASATDINEDGQILVMVGKAVFDVRSVLWSQADGSWEYIGDDTSNVYPIALNDDGMVLGQARNVHGQPVAVICRPGGRWERLGTADNWAPVDINNNGEVIGTAVIDRIRRPWLRRATGEIIMLPYITDHEIFLAALNNLGQIVGGATADHGTHALLWSLTGQAE